MKTTQTGLSLLELIICLAIASILLGSALPMTEQFVRQQRKVQEVNLLIGALNYTRAQASLQRRPLRLCAGTASGGCHDELRWQDDLLVIAGSGGDAQGAAGQPLMVFARSGDFSWRWQGAGKGSSIRFRPDGTAAGRNGTFTLCHRGEALHQVVVNFVGRIRSQNAAKDARCD